MRRPALLALGVLAALAAVLAFSRAGSAPGDSTGTEAASDEGRGVGGTLPGLTAALPSEPRPSPSEASVALPPTAAPPGPRRAVRARLVAVDATSGRQVDPGASFRWSFGAGCDAVEAGGRLGAGVQDVAALLPAGADATEVTVWIEGWGFRFARRRFPLRAREDEGLDEIRVALEPVEASAWSAVRVVLAGEGETGESDSVAESESIRLAISPPSTAYGPPRLVVEFEPGSPRARDVRVPFAASAVEIKALPRESVEDGRRVWTGPPRVRVDRAPEEGGAAATFAVVRLPAAVLELDLRYAGVERPEAIDWWGSWSVVTTDPRDGTRRGYVTTFYVRVGGGPDVVRVEREGGRLKALSGIAAGFTVAVDPPGPHDLRLSETTRAAATVEAKSAQPPR